MRPDRLQDPSLDAAMARLVSKHAQRSLLRGQEPQVQPLGALSRFGPAPTLIHARLLWLNRSAVWIVLLVVHLALRSPGSDHAVSTGVTVEIAVICGSLLTRLDPVDPEM